MTLRDLLQPHRGRSRATGSSAGLPSASPTRWRNGSSRSRDGFNVLPPYFPGRAGRLRRLVVPELQARGLFRREYDGPTLRTTSGCRACQRPPDTSAAVAAHSPDQILSRAARIICHTASSPRLQVCAPLRMRYELVLSAALWLSAGLTSRCLRRTGTDEPTDQLQATTSQPFTCPAAAAARFAHEPHAGQRVASGMPASACGRRGSFAPTASQHGRTAHSISYRAAQHEAIAEERLERLAEGVNRRAAPRPGPQDAYARYFATGYVRPAPDAVRRILPRSRSPDGAPHGAAAAFPRRASSSRYGPSGCGCWPWSRAGQNHASPRRSARGPRRRCWPRTRSADVASGRSRQRTSRRNSSTAVRSWRCAGLSREGSSTCRCVQLLRQRPQAVAAPWKSAETLHARTCADCRPEATSADLGSQPTTTPPCAGPLASATRGCNPHATHATHAPDGLYREEPRRLGKPLPACGRHQGDYCAKDRRTGAGAGGHNSARSTARTRPGAGRVLPKVTPSASRSRRSSRDRFVLEPGE